jgi:hypothetical protein
LSDGSDFLCEEETSEKHVLLKGVADQIGVSMPRLELILQEEQRKMGDRERGDSPVEPADDAENVVVVDDGYEKKGLEGADPPATILGGESTVVATGFANTRDSVAYGWDTEVENNSHIGSALEKGLDTEQPSPQAVEIENIDFKRLKSLGISRAVVVKLRQRELSMHLAAYLVMYDRNRRLEYEKLQQNILVGFRKNGVDGEALAGSHMLDSIQFVEAVWQQIVEDEFSTVGYRVKLFSFAAFIEERN